METTASDQENLIRSLVLVLQDEAQTIDMFETHISWILVAGCYAYKFKKVVHFDFLDFSTLGARLFYCREELRLNRRLAPDMYLDVVPVTGSPPRPQIGGRGAPIEYAVRMRAFPQQALWSHRIEMNVLSAREIDELARKLAQFHLVAAIASSESPWGSPEALQKIADENLALIAALAQSKAEETSVDEMRTWQIAQQQKLGSTFEKRKEQGFVRECHGDLHSGNIITVNDQVVAFDCIEFDEGLRWIDVMNDLAFICMDLQFHGLRTLATRLFNGYLETTGDYAAVAVLRYYQTECALVRWKIALLRARRLEADRQAAASCETQAGKYMAFALQNIRPAASAIVIMHGYSGSGKSTCSGHLAELLGAVRIRSDVERKRMHGMHGAGAPAGVIEAGLYGRTANRATYGRLCMLAENIVQSGLPVIVDATFLKKEQRRRFETLASELGVPFFIVALQAGQATLRSRITARAKTGHDPSDAGVEVLAHQLAHHEALSDDEKTHVLSIDAEADLDADAVRKACEPIMMLLCCGNPSNCRE